MSKKASFSFYEKEVLAQQVKERKCIWDANDKKHNQHWAVADAWKDIASVMNKSVMECKSAWNSMRDSRRYHMNVAQKRKSGSASLSQAVLDDVGDWELAEALSFLPPLRKRILTAASPQSNASCSREFRSRSRSRLSSYHYKSEPPSPSSPLPTSPLPATALPSIASASDRIEDALIRYLNAQAHKPQQEEALKHYDKFLYMDNMLKKLPDNVADDILFETICKIRAQIKMKHES